MFTTLFALRWLCTSTVKNSPQLQFELGIDKNDDFDFEGYERKFALHLEFDTRMAFSQADLRMHDRKPCALIVELLCFSFLHSQEQTKISKPCIHPYIGAVLLHHPNQMIPN